MTHNTLAPWAELVPDTGPMTVDDLLALPDDSRWQYELVVGRLVRMPANGFEASTITMNLAAALSVFIKPRQLGRITGPDGTYNLTQPGALPARQDSYPISPLSRRTACPLVPLRNMPRRCPLPPISPPKSPRRASSGRR